MKINILLCDTFPGLLPSNIPDYQSLFIDLFDSLENNIEYKIYNAFEGDLPKNLYSNELYIIPGSQSGAYEDKEWIKRLFTFIQEANNKKIPLVGVCFGHQVIAQALGGKVQKSDKGWGIGIRIANITSSDTNQYFPYSKMQLIYNHNDQVVELPIGAQRFATSYFCENEGFTIGNHILTFQGHPEYTKEYCKYLLNKHADSTDEELTINALHSLYTMMNMGKHAAKWMLDLVEK